MFLNPVGFLRTQCLTRYVLNKNFLHQYEMLCCTKMPFVMNKTIHTGQVDCREYIVKPYERPCPEDHDHKNMRLKRPMSPHLTIYAPCLPAMTSIAERITGTIVTFYAVMLAGGELFLSNGIDSYVSMIQSLNLGTFSIIILKLILGYPFAYHYFCGIRFCMFNLAKFMDHKEVYKSAYVSLVASAVMAVFFALR